ncbi:MAG: hypothetical protein GWP14_05405 [Actinobacteria bacterium]|nr:hypothetical protein [Actinomycetota bacterium]
MAQVLILRQHFCDFLLQVLKPAVRCQRSISLDLRAVQRDLAELDQTSTRTQPQHFEEQTFQVRLVVLPEAADRTVIGCLWFRS